MKKISPLRKLLVVAFVCLGVLGCASAPKGFLKIDEKSLEKRQHQMRQYDTTDEAQIITSVAGVLQDLNFTLDDSETALGFVSASKTADAVNGGQVALAIFSDMLGAFGGGYSNSASRCDKEQKVKASVIVKPSLDGKKMVVRVTFQRIVWNMSGQVNRVETIGDPAIYQKFYNSLSKAIFLEAQQI
ncbi:MAG: hypothetical protein NT079_00650 [Candidatus Omnitrophica bacterium]|nr:hypothetical protein [Candidatus Omnitrophota bacterium]